MHMLLGLLVEQLFFSQSSDVVRAYNAGLSVEPASLTHVPESYYIYGISKLQTKLSNKWTVSLH